MNIVCVNCVYVCVEYVCVDTKLIACVQDIYYALFSVSVCLLIVSRTSTPPNTNKTSQRLIFQSCHARRCKIKRHNSTRETF